MKVLTLKELTDQHKFSEADLEAVHRYGEVIAPQLPLYVERFYDWLRGQPEFSVYFTDADKLRRVQGAQVGFWERFFTVQLNDEYLDNRRRLGEVHADIGLTLSAYFSALALSQDLLLFELYPGGLSDAERSECLRACLKLIQIDASLVVEAYARLDNQRIAEQAEAMMEMSSPVTSLWDHILMLPVVGLIDSARARNMMNSVLHRISVTRSKVFIMDISGVSMVDTAVANHLIKITRAARLMGCACLLSGVSPMIAQTTVELGIDVGDVATRATLRDALEEAFHLINVEVRQVSKS